MFFCKKFSVVDASGLGVGHISTLLPVPESYLVQPLSDPMHAATVSVSLYLVSKTNNRKHRLSTELAAVFLIMETFLSSLMFQLPHAHSLHCCVPCVYSPVI